MSRHMKVPGYVEWVEDGRWGARLFVDGEELWAEMSVPLPSDMGEGNLFTIHTTKRSHQYLYWIRKPGYTNRQIKKARREAREMWKKLGFGNTPQEGVTIDLSEAS